MTFTPEPTDAVTVEAEIQSGEVVTTGTWYTLSETSASNGEVISSCTASDYVTYEFTGTAISVLFQKQYNAGITYVYLDDVLVRAIDTYWNDGSGTGKLYQQLELIADGLPYAPHE
ncbi:MAG: hypothetical protein WBB22_12415, partial [Anaerolineae bacterium]